MDDSRRGFLTFSALAGLAPVGGVPSREATSASATSVGSDCETIDLQLAGYPLELRRWN